MTIAKITICLAAALLGSSCALSQGSPGINAPVDPVAIARDALKTAEAAHPGNTPEVAKALNDLVRAEFDEGVFDADSVTQAERAVKVSEAAGGTESELSVIALSNLAETLVAQSRPAEARPFAERAVGIAEQSQPGGEGIIWAASALGDLCNALTDFPCAIKYDNEAIAAERLPGPDHEWLLAATLGNLSDVLERTGDHAGAAKALEEALAAAQHSHPNDPQISVLEADLGESLLRAQKFSEALPHLTKAAADLDRNFGPGNPGTSRVQISLGELYARTGQFALSYKNYEAAFANAQTTADELARERGAYSRALASGGDYSRAIEQGLLAEKMSRETFELQARTLPEREALAYEQHRPVGIYSVLSVIAKHPELPSAAIYEEVIHSRALVQDEMARRQRNLNATSDPEVARLLQDLKSAQAELLEAVSAPPAAKGTQAAIAAAQSRLDEIERTLAQRSSAVRNDEREDTVTLADLRRNMPAHSVLVSYVTFKREAVNAVDPAAVNTPSYLAFVLHADSNRIGVVDLGDSKTINDLVTRIRASAQEEMHAGGLGSARTERLYREAGAALRMRIWDPLRSELAGAKLAIVVPDGLLDLVPFAGLPEGKGYLIERGPVIHMLSSERDLIPSDTSARKTGMLAIGGPSFDLAEVSRPASPLRDTPLSCDLFQKLVFDPLPGAAEEVTDISATWKRWNKQEPFQRLTGAEATRTNFLDEAPNSRVLHVATHAFVLDRSCGGGNPLLHSGLVFAGANHSREAAILTAQQIASLDLNGVDLAVLSACNTGNGELRDGEGVLGLQRAFRIAGARSIVMTIWPVDDKVTGSFMHEFYNELLINHESTANAAWFSARKLLLDRRAAGLSTHPWYWAGYIGSGAQ